MILLLSNEKAGNYHVIPLPVCRKRLRVEMWMYDQLQALYAKEVSSSRLPRKRKTGDVVIKLLNTGQLDIKIPSTAGF